MRRGLVWAAAYKLLFGLQLRMQEYVFSCDKACCRRLDWLECDIVQMLQEGETFLGLAASSICGGGWGGQHRRSDMKKNMLFWFLLGGASMLHAQAAWFTVLGDPREPAVNTIEVDPIPVSVQGDVRTMKIRVSRSTQRTSWDGVHYRSYISTVQFDCANKVARYATLDFYLEPLWKGKSHKTSAYPEGVMRRMEFRDVTPNPTQRLIRAACRNTGTAKG
jgi:hypothetical protein